VKVSLNIPEWELKYDFNPCEISQRVDFDWVNYRGEALGTSTRSLSAEEVFSVASFDLNDLPFRNPNQILAGNLHNCCEEWEKIHPVPEVNKWIREGVKVEDFFRQFKGNFEGLDYNSDTPPHTVFQNATNCSEFVPFIIDTLTERICNGSISVVGKVGECTPPHLVLPITIEPYNLRLCHDERFLNLWIRDSPFHLDTLNDVPRVIERGSLMTSLDDKFCYDHVVNFFI